METDLVIQEDIDETMSSSSSSSSAVEIEAEAEPEQETDIQVLPEIEVDEWIDLEDQWEKDYYFVVFTDDELFQYMYGLYYPVLKDEVVAQHLSKQQVQSLKATLTRMRRSKLSSLPENVIPVYRGTRANLGEQMDSYFQLYKRMTRLPYTEGQRLAQQSYKESFVSEDKDPFLRLTEQAKRELELSSDVKVKSTDEEENENEESLDGGAPKKKKRTKKSSPPPAEKDEPPSTLLQNRLIAFAADETPLPIEAILHLTHMPQSAIPELYLKERVEHPAPTVQKQIPVDEMDWKKPSSLMKAIHLNTQYPLDDVLNRITELPSLHQLSVHLSTFGYSLDQLEPNALKTVLEHLEKLQTKAPKHSSSQRFVWNPPPVSGILPSEKSVFVPLKDWLVSCSEHLKKSRETYQERLSLLEKQSDIFTKHPGIALDIYDLAVRIRHQQIDLEEAITTLNAIHKEADTQVYIDFLRDVLQYDEISIETLAIHQAFWSLMDNSVFPEKTPILNEYHAEHTAKEGQPSYLLEDVRPPDEWVADEIPDIPDQPVDDADKGNEEFETFGDVFEPEDSAVAGDTEWMNHLPPTTETTNGQRELLVSVGGMLYDLQLKTELPLNMKEMFHFLLTVSPWMTRISQLEQLQEAFPDIPDNDLKVFMEQRMLWYTFESSEKEAAFRKKVSEVYQDYKKQTLELFIYAITWWVITLQDLYIRQPKQIVPTYAPCMPVWAFYGTPMSSSDEKGIARYLVCSSLSIHEMDPENSRWALLRSIPEKKFLDRIYKHSQLPEFTEKVSYLKQQWRDRWKEVARKEKELEMRLDVLEKSVGNPKEYLSLYVSFMLRLPTLIQQRDFQKKQAMVAPVANSCCYQPLSLQFQAFGDFKDVGLFEHHKSLKKHANVLKKHAGAELGRVRLNIPLHPDVNSSTFYTETTCRDTYSILEPDVIQDIQSAKEQLGVTQHQWNTMCSMIGQPSWALNKGGDQDEPIGELAVTNIRRANQQMETLLTTYISKNKRHLGIWRQWIEQSSWEEKLGLLTFLRTCYKQEQNLYGNIEWVESSNHRAIEHVTQWMLNLETWRTGVYPEAPTVLLEYILVAALMLPFVPEEDLKSLELTDPKWSRVMLERRFEKVTQRILSKQVPSNQSIQDYYAAVREKLKLESLAEYKSKTIDEIKELQDAKRLNLKKVYDQSYAGEENPSRKDDEYEAEGLAEHRAYAKWNSDDTNIEQLDE